MSKQKEEGTVQGNCETHKDVYKILKETVQYSQSCWQKKKNTYTCKKKHYKPGHTNMYATCPTSKERYDSKSWGFWGKEDVPRD